MKQNMLAVLCVVGTILAQNSIACADNRSESKQHFKAGLRLVDMEDFNGAWVEFNRSVELHPTMSGLFNLANVYKALHRYTDAMNTLTRLKTEFGDKLSEQLSSSVDAMVEEIETVTAKLEVSVPQDGVMVFVDGKPVGVTPLKGPLLVGPGEHIVTIHVTKVKHVSESISVVSGDSQVLNITIPEDPPPPPADPIVEEPEPVEAEPVPAPEPSKLGPWKWTSLAVTGALGITSGIFWGLAASKQSERDDMTDPATSSAGERQDTLDQGQAFNNVAVGMSIGTGVFAALTTVLFILDRNDEQLTTDTAVELGATPGQLTISF